MTKEQKELRRKIIEISFKHKLSHLGSCLSAVDLIAAIYDIKKKEEKFVLSNGHSAVALYAVLGLKKASVHPQRNPKLGIDFSTGSLGLGLSASVGMALADRAKNVYCMISDGECAEGIVWESFRIASQQKLINLKIVLNANGWGAYDPIDIKQLIPKFKAFGLNVVKVNGHNKEKIIKALHVGTAKPLLVFAKTKVEQLPFLKGQSAHYHVMSKEDYNLAMEVLK